MKIFCITLGLLVMSFSTAISDDFVNFLPRAQSPFFPSTGLLLGGSYANSNRDGNANTDGNAAYDVIAGVERYVGEHVKKVIISKGRYVGVTYRGEYGKTETVEGYVREIDETELTIQQDLWRKTIPRNKIDILLVCDRPSQLRDARRIIALIARWDSKNNDLSEVIPGFEQYVGAGARQVVVARGRYVGAMYRGEYGKTETVEGYVREMDETELIVYGDNLQEIVPRDKIDVLLVCDNPTQLLQAKNLMINPGQEFINELVVKTLSCYSFGLGFGLLGGLIGMGIGEAACEDFGCFFGSIGLGVVVGAVIGCVVGTQIFSNQESPDPFGVAMKGGLMGLGAGTVMTMAVNRKLWPSMLIGPAVGAAIMSRWSRDTFDARRFSVGLAPDRDGNLSAVATLRF